MAIIRYVGVAVGVSRVSKFKRVSSKVNNTSRKFERRKMFDRGHERL